MDKSELDILKEEFAKIEKKFKLPSFEELNQDFQIERICESETDYLIREVRKYMVEKFANYLRFVETLLNPSNAPMFVFAMVKTLGSEEKEKLQDIYKKIAKNEIELMEIDIEFDEEKEAEFIRKNYKIWQGIKEDLLKIAKVIKDNWDNKIENKNKGYFG